MPKADGWVKIHRKILAEELSSSQFKFFVGAILLAKSPKSKDSGLVDLSLRQLAKELKMDYPQVWRRAQELVEMGMITLLPQPQRGFIINNYHYYQTGQVIAQSNQLKKISDSGELPDRLLRATKVIAQSNQSIVTPVAKKDNKKDKKIKTIEKKVSPERKKLEFEDYIEELRPQYSDLDYDLELKKFHFYWSEGRRKLQRPKLALLNWMTKAREYKKEKEASHGAHRQGSRQFPKAGEYRSPEEIWPGDNA